MFGSEDGHPSGRPLTISLVWAYAHSFARPPQPFGMRPPGTGCALVGIRRRSPRDAMKERAMSQAPMAGYRPGECFVGAARKASRRLTQFYDDALEPCGLRSTQYSILSELARFASPPTLAELASALVSDRSAVGHNLRPLIRDGYVALEPGAEDRRERRIVLTPQGQLEISRGPGALAGGAGRISRSLRQGPQRKPARGAARHRL